VLQIIARCRNELLLQKVLKMTLLLPSREPLMCSAQKLVFYTTLLLAEKCLLTLCTSSVQGWK